MANDVKIRFKSFLPGGGFDSSGGAKQGKTRVVGEIDVTSYEKGEEVLSATDLGLTTIDSISLRVANETADPSGATARQVRYDKGGNVFYLVRVGETGIPDEYENVATETLEFDALGDSAADVELT